MTINMRIYDILDQYVESPARSLEAQGFDSIRQFKRFQHHQRQIDRIISRHLFTISWISSLREYPERRYESHELVADIDRTMVAQIASIYAASLSA